MDEAEVFLQERTLTDINRNALVAGELSESLLSEEGLTSFSVPTSSRVLQW